MLYKVTHPEFPEPCCEEHTIALAAGTTNQVSKDLIRWAWDNRDATFSCDYYRWLSDVYTDGLVRGWNGTAALKLGKFKTPADVSLDYSSPDNLAMQMMQLNVARFSAAKSAAAASDLNQLAREHDNFNDFRKAVEQKVTLYNEDWLKTEYNFAWNTGHTSAAWFRNMAQKEAFPTWIYETAGDARVRLAHQALQGLKFRAGEMDTIYPPNGWNCRCYIRTIQGVPNNYNTEKEAQGILASSGVDKNGVSEWDRMKKDGMNINRAKTKVVYDADKFYIKDKLAQKLTWRDQGLKKYSEMDQAAFPEAKLQETTINEAKQFIQDTEFTDNNKRLLILSEKTLKGHSTEEYLKTVKMIPGMLNHPDELYLFEDGRNNTFKLRYVKFYQGKPMNVVAQIDNENGFNILTWFEMDTNKVDGFRNGILIDKK